jgi:hypothetical protein
MDQYCVLTEYLSHSDYATKFRDKQLTEARILSNLILIQQGIQTEKKLESVAPIPETGFLFY